MTEEHKKKIGAANAVSLKGKKQSEETKLKRAASIRAYHDRMGRQTPEGRRAKERAYWAANKDKKKVKDARNYAKHRTQRSLKAAAYYVAHRHEAIERIKRWRQLNRSHCNTINANRRAREANAEGYHTTGEWEQLKIQHGFKCARCGRREPEIKLTRDHIIPLARGGTNYIENIQPLCGKCNCEKWAKMPDPD